MLEFAFVAPVLLMLLLGVIEIARFYFTHQSVKTLAAEGARAALVFTASSASGCTALSSNVTAVKNTALGKTPFLHSMSAAGNSFTITCTVNADGQYVIDVTITYAFQTLVPFLSFLSTNVTDSTRLTSQQTRAA